ncbi:MAG: DNA-processing protein DprA [Elusimicrobia bacterium]|nr:DNA-processing protein DprA [Elusimicrobiota bacterium]
MLALDGVGNSAVKKLLDHLGDVNGVMRASGDEIAGIAGIDRDTASRLAGIKNSPAQGVDDWLKRIEKSGYRLYLYGDEDYPALLSEIHDPPMMLYCDGEILASDYNSVAVVGTRKQSDYGRKVAAMIARKLAANNITVVSGCALGIDATAHSGALDTGGRTIAVLGSGLDHRYPAENRLLMERISESGAVVSEFHPDTEPYRHNFPLRNRVISGISLGTVIVEAPVKSGAMITAYHAAEQNRSVYAVPGNVFSQNSGGCIELIKKGAMALSDPEEVMEDLMHLFNTDLLKERETVFENEKVSRIGRDILRFLETEPVHIDRIVQETKTDINAVMRELTYLEMIGRVTQVGGKRYIKNQS